MPDFVKLVNEGNKPFDFHQNNVKRIIAPGEDAIVPWPIAATLFGNPKIPDIPPANERTHMYGKIRARHNFSAGLMREEEWADLMPHIAVYDIEKNERIIMLIEDPLGEHMDQNMPTPVGKQSDAAALQRQIEVLTAQVAKLVANSQATPQAAAEGNTASPTAVADGPGIVTDIDSVFNLPTSDETATADNPQAVPVGDIPVADDDAPPPKPQRKVAAKAS